MADPIANFIQTYMQQKQLAVAQQNADTQRLAASNQGQVDASTVMQGFMTALSHTNKDNRQSIVDAFAKSTGADPELLGRVASTIQDSPELLRQQAANDAVKNNTFAPEQIAAPALLGQDIGSATGSKHLSDFLHTGGRNLGPKGEALYQEYNAQNYAKGSTGQVAQTQAQASLPQGVLQRGATNAMGVTLTAPEAANLPIAQTQAAASMLGAQTGAQNSLFNYRLGIGGMQLTSQDQLMNAAVRLATMRQQGMSMDNPEALKLLNTLNQNSQTPMEPGASKFNEFMLQNMLSRMGLPSMQYDPAGAIFGAVRGAAGKAK